MANNRYILTDAGRNMLAKTGSSLNALTFSGIKISSTAYAAEQIPALTTLNGVQHSVSLTSNEVVNGATAKLTAEVSNNHVTVDYSWQSTGVYALNSRDNEILFAVGINSEAIPMRTITEDGLKTRIINIYLTTNNAENVSVRVSMDGYLNQAALETAKKEIFNTIFPIGRLWIDFGNTDPNAQFPWMTWVKIGEGQALVSAGNTYKVGNSYGANSKTISIAQLPKHQFNFTTNSAEGHQHYTTNGIYELGFDVAGNGDSNNGDPLRIAYGDDRPYHNLRIEAKTSWGGRHAHNGTTEYLGEGKAIDFMQRSIAVNVWQRTK
ncbi:MAG: hypothetical protein MR762_11825 [Clostridiales bacterium]|nr:hypothetical protein [Clostridiales bacterium]MDY2870846.1 hypothetical protein [Succiniclasticum sp.]